MILTENIEVKINSYNIDYYLEKNYNVKIRDLTIIDIKDLQKNSDKEIDVKCDICGFEKKLKYKWYIKNIKNHNFYTCPKCKYKKSEITLFEKYGVKNVAHLDSTKENRKKTCLEKYGTEHPLQNENIMKKVKNTNIKKYEYSCSLLNDDIKEKTMNTNLEKYGDISPQKDQEVRKKQKDTNIKKYGHSCSLLNTNIKEKTKKTMIEKYGVDHFSKSKIYKEEYKKTSIDRYGVEHPTQSNIIQDKIKKTCIDRFGVNNYFKTSEYKEKFEKTMIEKYGVNNYFKYEEFKNKMREDLIKNGFNVCSDDIEDWSRYKRTCLTLSHKNYKKLKNDWTGYDYYDDQYIKNNYIEFKPNNPNYPTVDHKISILYGYLNDITPDEISDIKNLCITKRCINSSKNSLIESVFMKIRFKKNEI